MSKGFFTMPFKKKFRWTFSVKGKNFEIKESWCRISHRPNAKLNDYKYEHEPMGITITDLDNKFCNWLQLWLDMEPGQLIYNFCDVTLKLYDGCGTELEQWVLKDSFPRDFSFIDLSYEETELDLIIIYKNANRILNCDFNNKFKNFWLNKRPLNKIIYCS